LHKFRATRTGCHGFTSMEVRLSYTWQATS
jgi:hypothetical protein